MIRKEVFEQVGGFDVEFPIDYNDVDLFIPYNYLIWHIYCSNQALNTNL